MREGTTYNNGGMTSNKRDIDFLSDDLFIEWRLLRTEELDQYWDDFLEKHPECEPALTDAIKNFKAVRLNARVLSEVTRNKLYDRIIDDVRRRKNNVRRIQYWCAAAGIALLMVSSVVLMRHDFRPVSKGSPAIDAFIGQTQPSTDIQLISGEKIVELHQDAQISLNNEGLASVVDQTNATELELPEDALNRLIVPSGKRSTLQLADGTKVWLNSGTELEFPSKFTGNTRAITVRGEIYIEVAKVANKPFYVETSQFKVSVLGTKFNVFAYPDISEKSIVLVEGAVEVNAENRESSRLIPGEMLAMNTDEIKKQKVNVAEYIGWKDGVLVFNKTPISEVLMKVGRYYNVTFRDNNNAQLSARTCTGKLVLSDNFDEVMTSVSALSSTTFYRKDDMVYVKDK